MLELLVACTFDAAHTEDALLSSNPATDATVPAPVPTGAGSPAEPMKGPPLADADAPFGAGVQRPRRAVAPDDGETYGLADDPLWAAPARGGPASDDARGNEIALLAAIVDSPFYVIRHPPAAGLVGYRFEALTPRQRATLAFDAGTSEHDLRVDGTEPGRGADEFARLPDLAGFRNGSVAWRRVGCLLCTADLKGDEVPGAASIPITGATVYGE